MEGRAAYNPVKWALQAGYRHIVSPFPSDGSSAVDDPPHCLPTTIFGDRIPLNGITTSANAVKRSRTF